MIIKDETTGEDVTVFSQEELDAKITAEKTAVQSQLDAALVEKTKLEEQIAAAAGGDDSKNFASLKAKLSEKDADIKSLKESNQKISDLRLQDIKSEVLGKFSRGDAELAKVILHNYDTTLQAVKAESREDIAKKMESAYKLSRKESQADLVGQANYQSGAAGWSAPGTSGAEIDPKVKDLGKKMGVSDDDWKKYGPKTK